MPSRSTEGAGLRPRPRFHFLLLSDLPGLCWPTLRHAWYSFAGRGCARHSSASLCKPIPWSHLVTAGLKAALRRALFGGAPRGRAQRPNAWSGAAEQGVVLLRLVRRGTALLGKPILRSHLSLCECRATEPGAALQGAVWLSTPRLRWATLCAATLGDVWQANPSVSFVLVCSPLFTCHGASHCPASLGRAEHSSARHRDASLRGALQGLAQHRYATRCQAMWRRARHC